MQIAVIERISFTHESLFDTEGCFIVSSHAFQHAKSFMRKRATKQVEKLSLIFRTKNERLFKLKVLDLCRAK